MMHEELAAFFAVVFGVVLGTACTAAALAMILVLDGAITRKYIILMASTFGITGSVGFLFSWIRSRNNRA